MYEKKKIIVFIDWFLPAYKAGGPIQSISNLVNNLKNEMDIWIVTSNEDLGERLELDKKLLNLWQHKDGFHIIYLDKKHRNLKNFRKLLKSSNFICAYFNSLFSIKFTLMPLWLCHKMNIQAILAPRGMLGKGALSIKPFKKKLFLWGFKFLKMHEILLWHATDSSEEMEIKMHFGNTSRVSVVPNLSAKTPNFIEKNKNVGILNLFFISRIAIKKQLLFAINVLKQVNSSNQINFTIVGPIDEVGYWKKCQSAILELPSNVNTNYLGAIPNHKLQCILKNQHVLFLPTQHENFGHVIVESWQSSCPVLISNNTPWKNLESQKLGFDLSLNSPDKFKTAIEFFLKINQKEFNEWSQSSNNFAKSISDNTDLILQTKNIFNNCIIRNA